jgi:MFS family permease
VLLLTALIFIFGVLGEAMATTAEMLVWFRILVGVGIGVETTIAPLYIAEVSQPIFAGVWSHLISFSTAWVIWPFFQLPQ